MSGPGDLSPRDPAPQSQAARAGLTGVLRRVLSGGARPGGHPARLSARDGRDSGLTGAHLTVRALLALEFAPPLAEDIPALALARRPGMTATRGPGQGHLIRELRPFTDGDDPRLLDAAASARSGSPHVRSFHEDREGNLLLIADFRRSMLWGTELRLRSLAAAEVLMRLGWQAMRDGGAVGLVTLTDAGLGVVRPRPRPAGLLQVAAEFARAHEAALALPRSHPQRELGQALSAALRHAPPGAMVALASGLDHTGDAFAARLAALARRGPSTLLLVEDRLEQAPPAGPLPCHAEDRPGEAARLLALQGLSAARARRADETGTPGLRVVRIAADQLPGGPRL